VKYPHTIEELVEVIYEDNEEHFASFNDETEGDCDCALHITLTTIVQYWGE
jgi:hypothetical protein